MRVYFDCVDRKWRIKGYEEHHFSTEEDAEAACEFALEYALEYAPELQGVVDTGPASKESA